MRVVIVFDILDATDTRTHRDADGMSVFLSDFEVGIVDSVHRRGDAVVYERIVLALVFFGQVVVDIEVFDEAGNTRRKRAGIEVLDQGDPGNAFADSFARRRPGDCRPAR